MLWTDTEDGDSDGDREELRQDVTGPESRTPEQAIPGKPQEITVKCFQTERRRRKNYGTRTKTAEKSTGNGRCEETELKSQMVFFLFFSCLFFAGVFVRFSFLFEISICCSKLCNKRMARKKRKNVDFRTVGKMNKKKANDFFLSVSVSVSLFPMSCGFFPDTTKADAVQ